MVNVDQPVCIAPTADRCGEGIIWHAAQGALYWTDINRFLVHRLNPEDGCVRTWFFDEPATTVMLTDRDDTLALLLASRLILWQPAGDVRRDQGFRLESWPHNRFNDAAVDPRGAIWAGSMRNNVNPDGSSSEAGGEDGVLRRLDPDGRVTEWRRNIGCSNTVVWSPDRTRFYNADTLANTMNVYSYDPSTGDISNQRDFFSGFSRGFPDGSAIDAEGYLWNCRYAGRCIVRIEPGGGIDRVIEMPTHNITNCTFGGPDLKTLYVTTAAADAAPGDRFAGGLFAISTDVQGQPENRFHLQP